ncbi:hypothetical protein NP590_07415 [Methylomonas sp. SURF-2]|uniref:Uncharacterized protein n=1 Tax=Methylomonas subterranea TaxID=2952225 RepID=A0ABT1TEM5_9GAMM|nr:hypothetical protein [Methylomonas sp. SURF-2]MCQ8103927.1 hypothetical protein [Methylomonas sp. SURF-2]
MKSEKYLFAFGALLLVWSMRGEAHDSHEAVMEGGNLMQLTHALLHPVLEIPYLPAFLIGTLIVGLVLRPVILHIARHRIGSKSVYPTVMEKPAIAPKTDNL